MKKFIAILTIAIVLVGAVFAASGDTLTLTSTVSEHKPGFKIFGGEVSSAAAATEGTSAGASIASSIDITADPITVYCRIKQYSVDTANSYSQTKCKFRGVATIDVVASALSQTIGTGETAQTFSTAATASAVTTTLPNNVTKTAATNTNNAVQIILTYAGSTVQDSAVYADFSFTWAQDDTLPPGQYTANIEMTYTVV